MEKTKLIYSLIIGIIIFILLAGISYILLNRNEVRNFNFDFTKKAVLIKSNTNNDVTQFTNSFNQNDFKNANAVADAMLQKNQNDFQALLLKASSLAQQASLEFREKELGDQAMTYADQALAINPQSVDALTLKGYIYEIQQDYTNAHKYYDQALAIEPNNDNTLSHKAHAYALQGNPEEAYKLYKQAIEINPNSTDAMFGLAKIYLIQNKFDDAKNLFLQVASLSKNKREIAESYVSASIATEFIQPFNIDNVETYVDKAIQIDPTFPSSYISKARIIFAKAKDIKDKDERVKAISDSFDNLSKAISLNKNQANAHLQVAIELYTLGNTKDAIIVFKALPKIIDADITLSKNDKIKMNQVVQTFISKINKK